MGNSETKEFIADLLKPGARFDLEIGWHGPADAKKWDAVREAVACWASFGGVGARTRRGCGAIKVTDAKGILLPLPKDRLEKCGCQIRVAREFGSAHEAWEHAVSKLKEFRQGKGFARNAGDGKTPGQSRWPEADSIRRITKMYYKEKGGKKTHAPKNRPEVAFPRAFFGMPIITHFKDARKDGAIDGTDCDPDDTELLPVQADTRDPYNRMASPLILRPVPKNEKEWMAVALLLPIDHLKDIKLRLRDTESGRSWLMGRKYLWSDEFANDVRPLDGLPANPLDAFMEYFSPRDSVGGSRRRRE